MNSHKTYQKLSTEKKIVLVNRILKGESVSKISHENDISRTILYRWLKEYSVEQTTESQPLSAKNPKGKKHWRKLKYRKEQEVVGIWLKNPDYSIRKIATQAEVSPGGVWNIIGKYKLKAESSGRKVLRHRTKSYKVFSEDQKIELVKRYENGEMVSRLAVEAGVSRTIFYRWIKRYKDLRKYNYPVLNKRPRGENHWRFIPGISDLVLSIVSEHPEYSLSKLRFSVLKEDLDISKTGLYYILRRLDLTTPQQRFAYAKSGHRGLFMEPQTAAIEQMSGVLIYMFIALFGGLVLFHSLTGYLRNALIPNKNNFFVTTSVTPTQSVSQPEDKSGQGTVSDEPEYVPESDTEQNLNWGALALNSGKSMYKTGEDIQLGFGVVDSRGRTICNADIILEIISDSGNTPVKSLTTNDGSIQKSGECTLQSVTNTADYIADVSSFNREGIYELLIKAQTYEGEKVFREKLIIDNTTPFEIARSSYPTRIFPEANYPVEINIKANQDFTGEITEILPKGITASLISRDGVVFKKQGGEGRLIKWNVAVKRGQTYKISYNLHFPKVYPEFYEVGPLSFTEKSTGKTIFTEAKYWQIVADAL